MRSGWIDGNGSIGETERRFKNGPVIFFIEASS